MNTKKPIDDISEIVRQQLDPLFATFYPSSPQYMTFLKNVQRFALRLAKSFSKGTDISEALEALQKMLLTLAKSNNPETWPTLPSVKKMATLMQMFTYLSVIELLADPYIDLTILLLTARGSYLHMPPDRHHFYYRHATSLEDLDSPALPLSMKLAFLEENEITFFSKWIDRDLRNQIAHSEYEIDNNGQLLVEVKGKKKTVDIPQKLNVLYQYTSVVQDYVLKQFQKLQPTPQK